MNTLLEKINQLIWRKSRNEDVNTLKRELEDALPSGSGIDCGTKIDLEESNLGKIVLNCEFHHMNEGGMYDGWISHSIVVRPDWSGIRIDVTGRDKNQIKDYLADVYYYALTEEFK